MGKQINLNLRFGRCLLQAKALEQIQALLNDLAPCWPHLRVEDEGILDLKSPAALFQAAEAELRKPPSPFYQKLVQEFGLPSKSRVPGGGILRHRGQLGKGHPRNLLAQLLWQPLREDVRAGAAAQRTRPRNPPLRAAASGSTCRRRAACDADPARRRGKSMNELVNQALITSLQRS
ncbi:MAG: hypothetical protein V3T83_07685, partial [Acidobacteriota bacterium]